MKDYVLAISPNVGKNKLISKYCVDNLIYTARLFHFIVTYGRYSCLAIGFDIPRYGTINPSR